METRLVDSLLRPLREQRIPTCLVGEIALNYYNAPRVLHEIEICVPASALLHAARLLISHVSFIYRDDVTNPDVLTKHKKGFPRFRLNGPDDLFVTIFPDTYLHLEPLKANLVSFRKAAAAPTHYSREILDILPAKNIPQFPFPNLPAFFLGACKRYSLTQDSVFAMTAQQLVDGMDLDEKWCNHFIPNSMPKELEFALSLVRVKAGRESDLVPDSVMRLAEEQAEPVDIRKIPGRNIAIRRRWKWYRSYHAALLGFMNSKN